MEFDWSYLSEEHKDVYRQLCPVNEYRVITLATGQSLPGLSERLLNSCSSTIFIAASGDNNGRVYYMTNLHRPDPKDRKGPAIDQMPFGFIFDNKVDMLSGALTQHGNWDERSAYPVPSEWQNLVDGNIGAYTQLQIIPEEQSGSIFDLKCNAQLGAFSTIIGELSAQASKIIIESENKRSTSP
jgi:hypothetical protein